jgi:hypothetical protein
MGNIGKRRDGAMATRTPDDGIDTFSFDHDKIRVQTVKHSVHPG